MTKGNLTKRINDLQLLFDQLQNTGSRLEKEDLIREAKESDPYMEEDLNYCFEILSGKHKLGFIFNAYNCEGVIHPDDSNTLREYLTPLCSVIGRGRDAIRNIGMAYGHWGFFIERLVNREYKLGINKSQLSITDLTPMLAKKYDPNKIPVDDTYYLTEKLDGNRCIARYSIEKGKWEFISRSGKLLKAVFDMTGLPTDYIYDGEILSLDQIEKPSQENFNALSGQLNSKYGDKSRLIYMIFDIICNMPYKERSLVIRAICVQKLNSNNVRILPVLCSCGKDILIEVVDHYLDEITSRGGEGVMINLGSATYQHKRTDKLLKVKNVYTMDMRVVSILQGSGKYSGQVGSLVCCAVDPTDKVTEYVCQVGSGINDYQRYVWSTHPEDIIGKIVEVAYFSLSQDNNNRGTPTYSLRFPRLKRVRHDKTETSID